MSCMHRKLKGMFNIKHTPRHPASCASAAASAAAALTTDGLQALVVAVLAGEGHAVDQAQLHLHSCSRVTRHAVHYDCSTAIASGHDVKKASRKFA